MIQFLNTYKPREDLSSMFAQAWADLRQVQADRKRLEDLMREAGIAKPTPQPF